MNISKFIILLSLILVLVFILNQCQVDTYKKENEREFDKIYREGKWGRPSLLDKILHRGPSHLFSGSGSDTSHGKCDEYISYIQRLIKNPDITYIVEIGCGDWRINSKIDWSGKFYTGYDVVKDVIDYNRSKHSRKNVKFVHGDAAIVQLPPGDLVIIKDVLQHLPINDIITILEKCLQNYRFLLITNDVIGSDLNSEIVPGGHRALDIRLHPFNLRGNIVVKNVAGSKEKMSILVEN